MTINALDNPVFKSVLPNGDPNSLGTIGVYSPGNSFTTTVTIWDTQTKDNALANPFTLNSAGEAEIWFDGTVDIEVKDADGNILPKGQVLNVSSSIPTVATGNFNIVKNGSFEIDSDTDTFPDNWTLVLDSGATIAIDSTSGGQAHGNNGLKFTGTGSGAGSATSDKFNVLADAALNIIFTYKSTAATTTNVVTMKWYKFDDTASATPSTVVYTEAASNPSSFTTYTRGVAVPSDATRAEIVLDGVLSSGTDKSGPTWFDDVQVISVPIDQMIFDSNGNEVLETGSVASAVNHLKITNNSTGLPAVISVEGEVDQGINFNSADSEEMLKLRASSAAVNELTVTSTATGVPVKLSNDGEDDIGFDINAKNSEEMLKLRATAAAVNEVTITSNATGSAPSVSATGDDTNVDLNLAGKGTGEPKIDGFPATSRRVLIEEQTVSAVATVDFTTGIDSTYDMYEVDVIAALPSVNQAPFGVSLSTDTGSSWSTIVFLTGIGTNGPSNIAAEGGVSGTLQLPDPSTAKTHQNVINMGLCYTQDNGAVSTITQIIHGRSVTASLATDGIQLAFNSSNITSGTFKLYGVR